MTRDSLKRQACWFSSVSLLKYSPTDPTVEILTHAHITCLLAVFILLTKNVCACARVWGDSAIFINLSQCNDKTKPRREGAGCQGLQLVFKLLSASVFSLAFISKSSTGYLSTQTLDLLVRTWPHVRISL